MKIEGMQYPLPIRPVGQRSEHTHNDVDVSDDAVYFEPDERRRKEEQHSQQEQAKQESLDEQVQLEASPVKTDGTTSVADEAASKKPERPALNITA